MAFKTIVLTLKHCNFKLLSKFNPYASSQRNGLILQTYELLLFSLAYEHIFFCEKDLANWVQNVTVRGKNHQCLSTSTILPFMLGDLNVIPLAETQIALPVKLREGPEEVFFPNEGKELFIFLKLSMYKNGLKSVFRLYLQYFSMTYCLSS